MIKQPPQRFHSEYELEALRIPPIYRKYCTNQAVDTSYCMWKNRNNLSKCEDEVAGLRRCTNILQMHTRNNNLMQMYMADPKKFEEEKVAQGLFDIQNPLRALRTWTGFNLH